MMKTDFEEKTYGGKEGLGTTLASPCCVAGAQRLAYAGGCQRGPWRKSDPGEEGASQGLGP